VRNELVTVVVVLLVAGSLGVGYFTGYSRQTVIVTNGTNTIVGPGSTYYSTTTKTLFAFLSNPIIGSFSYSPMGQVKVDKVWATATPASNGRANVTFLVTFENTGSSPVYVLGGFVGMLAFSVSGNSTIIQAVTSNQCTGGIYVVALNQTQHITYVAPDCSNGFNYQLVHPGNLAMVFNFGWTINPQTPQNRAPPFSNSTTIKANFIFG